MKSFSFAKLLLGCLLSLPVCSQTSQTYVVTQAGDTVYAAVRFSAKLADNNREVYATHNGQTTHYTPYELKAFYNGLQEYETVHIGDMPVFLQRHTQGTVSLYYCDETVLAQLIRRSPRLGDEIGNSLGEALNAALHSVKKGDSFEGKVLVLCTPDRHTHVIDPNHSRSKEQVARVLYDYPGTESFLGQEKLTPEVYEQLIMAYNLWKTQAMTRMALEENVASGF